MNKIEKKEYLFSNDTGDAVLTIYEVFPGVRLVYNSVHMDRLDMGGVTEGNLIEIHHCCEGRIEQEFEGEYFYLMPGDLSIAMRTKNVNAYTFPLSHYHGITISINTDVAPGCFSEFLQDVRVKPLEVAKKLCGDNNCFIIRSQTYIEHIFSELYSVPESIKAGYFKVKILELLLVLSGLDLQEKQVMSNALPKSQVQLANQIAAYLAENMEQHVTIAELSKIFSVSDTHLKNIFKGVYGVPIYTYMRIQKMQSAAQLLIHTERSVAEIAYEFGYNNTSKFTAAFQKVMGETPSEYRKVHAKTTARQECSE